MIRNDTNIEKESLTPRQLKAIPFILEALPMERIAEKVGIKKNTIYRWLRKKHFREKVEQERQRLFDEGLATLKAATSKAAIKMIELLDSENDNLKRLAAKDILNFALRSFETEDLEKRIEAIEDILEKRLVS